MNNIKIFFLVLFLSVSLISCGDSAYVKQLKSDLTSIETKIRQEMSMRDFYSNKIDSIFMSPNPSNPDVLKYLRLNIDKQDILINELKSKKKEIELEILKNK